MNIDVKIIKFYLKKGLMDAFWNPLKGNWLIRLTISLGQKKN
jgi:hypothetical protein